MVVGGLVMGFPQPSQKVETLLGFSGDGACVKGSVEVFYQVNKRNLVLWMISTEDPSMFSGE